MATYVIGDVHGCHRTLEALLRQLDIDYRNDRIWLVGDLINRGPGSLDALRWAIDHSHCITMVLGNHELHLLAAEVGAAKLRKKDTLRGILEAPDRDDLLSWVRNLPLLHREGETFLVHAGLRAGWTAKKAERIARNCEEILRGKQAPDALRVLRGRDRAQGFEPSKRLLDLSFMTRVRVVDDRGEPHHGYTGPPEETPEGCKPWFLVPRRLPSDHRIFFGHWAALGLRIEESFCALDAGCFWGGHLAAIRLDDLAVYRQANIEDDC